MDPAVSAVTTPPSKRKARKAQRLAEDLDGSVPLSLFGLSRWTIGVVTALCVLFAIFTLAPIAWIVINSTKTQANIFQSFGYWFARPFELFHNFANLFTSVDGQGIYIQWLGNTALYAFLGGLGATVFAALGGYGFARFKFRGAKTTFYVILATLLVPISAITLPLYLVYAKVGLINSIWGMILPSMVSPVGLYLMTNFIRLSVPTELLDAARVDGAGEVRIFFRLALPLMVPGLFTVLLISVVGVWNNYFLPLIIFSKTNLYPITVGLGNWSQRAQNGGSTQIFPELVMGGFVTIVPLVVIFLCVQRYWKSGLLVGSVTG